MANTGIATESPVVGIVLDSEFVGLVSDIRRLDVGRSLSVSANCVGALRHLGRTIPDYLPVDKMYEINYDEANLMGNFKRQA